MLPELEREFGLGMSTPRDLARLMELIAEGKVVSRAACDEMLGLLRAQQFRTMITRRLPEADDVKAGDKPGWDEEKRPGPDGIRRHVRIAAGVVETPRARYVIAICARQVRDTRWGVDNDALVTGADVARVVHDEFDRPDPLLLNAEAAEERRGHRERTGNHRYSNEGRSRPYRARGR